MLDIIHTNLLPRKTQQCQRGFLTISFLVKRQGTQPKNLSRKRVWAPNHIAKRAPSPLQDGSPLPKSLPVRDNVAIDEFYGREVEKVEELNEIQNGLMLSIYAEKRLEDGDVVLVPDVKDAASQDEIDAWSRSEPKEYKIRVISPKAKGMDRAHPGYIDPKETWNNLDGKRVHFSSDHRPCSRYLYWQYCEAVLRQSWKEKDIKAKDVLMRERGKKLWGTKGPCIKKRTLLAIVEQLGHDYEALMENAIVESKEDDNPESNPSALQLASAEIRRSHCKYRKGENGEDEDEDEESDDDESS